MLAIIYIVRGLLTKSLDQATADALARMVYGIVCFATLFSLVGTVLGGIWADQSWGRFWGWDPKENGALIIVLWNAIILHCRSAEMVRQRMAEEALNQADPELAAWLRIYRQLSAPDGEKYFLETLKPSPLPRLRGTVILCTPDGKPSEISLGLSSAGTEEVVLKLNVPFANAAEPGTQIHFQGTADAFVKAPFRLTVLAGKENIDGWPEAPPPPGKK